MEGAIRQLGGYLKAARKLARKESDYSRVKNDDAERIVEMVDIVRMDDDLEDVEEEAVVVGQQQNGQETTAEESRLLVSGTPLCGDEEKQELVNETLNALRSMKELNERVATVRQQNQLLRKARRVMQRRHLDTSSTSPLITST
jgi:hypothetical protein